MRHRGPHPTNAVRPPAPRQRDRRCSLNTHIHTIADFRSASRMFRHGVNIFFQAPSSPQAISLTPNRATANPEALAPIESHDAPDNTPVCANFAVFCTQFGFSKTPESNANDIGRPEAAISEVTRSYSTSAHNTAHHNSLILSPRSREAAAAHESTYLVSGPTLSPTNRVTRPQSAQPRTQ